MFYSILTPCNLRVAFSVLLCLASAVAMFLYCYVLPFSVLLCLIHFHEFRLYFKELKELKETVKDDLVKLVNSMPGLERMRYFIVEFCFLAFLLHDIDQ